MSFWYLASPYSKYPHGTAAAYIEACRNAGLLIRHKIPVFCPIAHTHPVAEFSGLPLDDHRIWLPADQPFIDAAHGIIVLKMESWATSYGVSYEIVEFRKAGKPIIFMEPGEVPEELL